MKPKLLDVVALLVDMPKHGLVRGQVGTLVEKLDGDFFEVEFSDRAGHTVATLALQPGQFLVLRPQVAIVA